MKKIRIRIGVILTTFVCVIISLFLNITPTVASNVEYSTADNLYYTGLNIDSDGNPTAYSIAGESTSFVFMNGMVDKTATSVTIYPTYNDKPVISIGEFAFSHAALTSVTFAKRADTDTWQLTTIGNDAFSSDIFTSIALPSSVTTIGGGAFRESSLTTIKIIDGTNNDLSSSNITSIGSYAFHKSKISSFIFPTGLTYVSNNMFSDCTNLSSVTFNNQNYIGKMAFALGTTTAAGDGNVSEITAKITSLTLPTVENLQIDELAFYFQKKITYLSITSNVTYIGTGAFASCYGLTEIHIASYTTVIERKVFSYDLNGTTVGSSTRAIIYCHFLESNYSSTYFKENWNYSNLTVVYNVTPSTFYSNPITYALHNGNTPTAEITRVNSGTTSVTIPSTITSNNVTYSVNRINDYAFYYCNLTSLTIPTTITSIGANALYGCTNLTTLTLPFVGATSTSTGNSDSVLGYLFGTTNISNTTSTKQYYTNGNTTYYIPTSLVNVTITNQAAIPQGAFYNCTNLTTITIQNCTSYGTKCMFGCNSLTTLTTPFIGSASTSGTGYVSVLGYLFGSSSFSSSTKTSQYTSVTVSNYSISSSSTTNYYIPNSLVTVNVTNQTTLPIGAFSNCTKITTINLSATTTIETYAFYNMSQSFTLTLPTSTLTTIKTHAFDTLSSLSSSNINLSSCTALSTIEKNGFYNVNGFDGSNIILQSSVQTVVQDSFYSSSTSYTYNILSSSTSAVVTYDSTTNVKWYYFDSTNNTTAGTWHYENGTATPVD